MWLDNLIDVGITGDLISFFKKKFHRLKEGLRYSQSPRIYIQNHIEILYGATKKKDAKKAYNSFEILAHRFKIKRNLSEIFDISVGMIADVDWDSLSESFLEVLKKYKEVPSNERAISFEEIKNMEKDLTNSLKQSQEEDDEANCLSCGAKIPLNDSKCPKCGWSWSS